jgi:hypothetical protein
MRGLSRAELGLQFAVEFCPYLLSNSALEEGNAITTCCKAVLKEGYPEQWDKRGSAA